MSIFYNNIAEAAANLQYMLEQEESSPAKARVAAWLICNTRMSEKEERQFLHFMALKKVATPQGNFAIVSLNEEKK